MKSAAREPNGGSHRGDRRARLAGRWRYPRWATPERWFAYGLPAQEQGSHQQAHRDRVSISEAMSKIVEFDLQIQQSRELSLKEFLRNGPRDNLAYWADLTAPRRMSWLPSPSPFAMPDRVLPPMAESGFVAADNRGRRLGLRWCSSTGTPGAGPSMTRMRRWGQTRSRGRALSPGETPASRPVAKLSFF